MTVSILGSQISCLPSYEVAFTQLQQILKINKGTPHYITVNNVHTVVEAVFLQGYRAIINKAFMAIPDGKPLCIIGKCKSGQYLHRIFGPTFMEKTLDWGQKDGICHFFFGSSEETLQKMKRVIQTRFPEAKIAGMISPPFKPFTVEENEYFIQKINEANPDIIWVSLGAPKQEIWMYENYKKLNRGVMIGIGAGFDYLAGNTKHAPQWMKNMALEWLYRLIQEPRRLWKRYLITNILFILFVLLEALGMKKFY